TGLLALENPADINTSLTIRIGNAGTVAHQRSRRHGQRYSERRQLMSQTQRSNLFAPTREIGFIRKKSASSPLHRSRKGCLDFIFISGIDDNNVQTEPPGRRLCILYDRLRHHWAARVRHYGDPSDARDELVQQLQLLCRKLAADDAHPGRIAPRPVEAR